MSEAQVLAITKVGDCLLLKPETVRRGLRMGKLHGASLGSDSDTWCIAESEVQRFLAATTEVDAQDSGSNG